MMADAFYVPDGAGYRSTERTRGPWDPDAQHAGPPTALLARALERCEPRETAMIGRITFEILRPVPIATLQTRAAVRRAGRSVELLEGELVVGDETVMLARAWRVRTADTGAVAGLERAVLPPPDDGVVRPFFPMGHDIGYHTSMDCRFLQGGFTDVGPASVWMRMRQPLVEGEEPSPLQRVLAAADSGNGVSAALDFDRYVFVNTDLTVHLHRLPRGEWVHLDARTVVEPHGVGLAESSLSDEHGPLGRSLQTLFVATRG
jgi:hypothetical protein